MRSSALKLFFVIVIGVFFTGCSLKYAINEPVVSDIKYDKGEKKRVVMKVVDQRTDPVFHQKTSNLKNVNIELENMERPVSWLSIALEKEFAARGIPLEITDKDTPVPPDLVLNVKKYQIVSRRVSGYSPWESFHSFMGELKTANKTCAIPAYFYNGKVPIWSMSEIQEPCFNMPISIMVKEIASKINRCALNYSVSDETLGQIKTLAEQKIQAEADDAYIPVIGLGSTNNPEALKELMTFSDAKDRFIRACALSAIGTMGAENELEFLKKKYAQYDEADRFMALKSIGDIGSPEAIEFIRQVKQDPQYSQEEGLKYCVDLFLEK
jgi:hypothetical protein